MGRWGEEAKMKECGLRGGMGVRGDGRRREGSVLRRPTVVGQLRYYRRSETLFLLTKAFCRRFLPATGDRTVDQMVQAARSTKQNIVEGLADGETSLESELKLLGVARGSVRELLEDYVDYLGARGLGEWKGANPRFEALHRFCREHDGPEAFAPFFSRWSDEEMANCAICLCHMVDKALTSVILQKDAEFVEWGGIRERMTAARLARRAGQAEEIRALRAEVAALRAEVGALRRRGAAAAVTSDG